MATMDRAARYREVLRFAIPVSLQGMLQSLFGLVDQLFVASLGEDSFVAAGLAGQIITTSFVLIAALGGGAAVQLARHAGAKDEAEFSATAAHLIQVSTLFGAVLALGLLVWAGPVFRLMGAEPGVVERGVFFIQLLGWSMPLLGLTEAASNALRAQGDVRVPALIGAVALGVNTALSYVLIFGVGGVPQMGMTGVAVATLVARGLALVLMGWRLFVRGAAMRVHPRELLRFQWSRMSGLFGLALPIAAGQGIWVLGMMGYTRVYAALGTTGLAAVNAVGALEGLWFTFSFGLGAACLTLVGQELGRKDVDAARTLAGDVLRLTSGVSLLTGASLALCSLGVGTLYPRLTENTLALAAAGLVVTGMMQPIKLLNMVLAYGVLRGGGDLRFTLACELLITLGIASAYVLGVWLGFGYLGAMAGKACEEALKLAAHLWRFRSQRWIHQLT